jgi:hypothetical protein
MIYIADAATLYQYVSILEGAHKVSVLCTTVSINGFFVRSHVITADGLLLCRSELAPTELST